MRYYLLPLFGLILLSFSNVFGQRAIGEKPKPCTNHPLSKGKYKILSISTGAELQFYLEIEPKYRTDKNFVDIAKEFKEKYCQEQQLRVIYFASKKNWQITNLKDLKGTPFAIFYTGKNTSEKEGITIYKVVDGKVESRTLDSI